MRLPKPLSLIIASLRNRASIKLTQSVRRVDERLDRPALETDALCEPTRSSFVAPQSDQEDSAEPTPSDSLHRNHLEMVPDANWFDAEFYLTENPDVREAGVDPFIHYRSNGMSEGRLPNAISKERVYRMYVTELCTPTHQEIKCAIFDQDFRISIVTPAFNTHPAYLQELRYTILNQIYSNWEWIIVDDGSSQIDTLAALNSINASDPRIKVIFLSGNSGISRASNIAISAALGNYIALVDHDDLLARDAFLCVYERWKLRRDIDMFYTDECKLMPDGKLGWFWGKPAWSPAYLENTMYVGHLTIYRSAFIRALGGFRPEFDGTQDFDLALRAALHNPTVCHVPSFAYIWRVIEGSAALDVNEKHYAIERQKAAVLDYARKKNSQAAVDAGSAIGYWRILYPKITPPPSMCYIIYTSVPWKKSSVAVEAISDCIRSFAENNFYSNCYFAVAHDYDHDSIYSRVEDVLPSPQRLIVSCSGSGSLGERLNTAASQSRANFFCFLDQNIRPVTAIGGEHILSYMFNNPEVGTVSPVFLCAKDTIWQNGIAMLNSGLTRIGHGQSPQFAGPNNLLRCRREVFISGEGMIFVSAEQFRILKGFDASLSDTITVMEFQQRVRQSGRTCVVDPNIEVNVLREGCMKTTQTVDCLEAEKRRFEDSDPYYSRWYDQDKGSFEVRFDPLRKIMVEQPS